ncbi:MAG: hypothetical protein K2J94_08330, partial [Duncaniella sp.]|nr:hypothetical protein [Duncaniella sp.]
MPHSGTTKYPPRYRVVTPRCGFDFWVGMQPMASPATRGSRIGYAPMPLCGISHHIYFCDALWRTKGSYAAMRHGCIVSRPWNARSAYGSLA